MPIEGYFRFASWYESWSAANGGVANGGLRGVWPPVLDIGRNWLFHLFLPFSPFSGGPEKIQTTEEKGPFTFQALPDDGLYPPKTHDVKGFRPNFLPDFNMTFTGFHGIRLKSG